MMKNIFKKNFWIFVCVFLIMAVTVFAGGQTEKKENISVWHVWGGTRLPLMEKQIENFEKDHPGITVEHLLVDQNVLEEKYLTAISAGEPPEVMMVFGSSFFPRLVEKGALLSLDEYIKEDGIEGEKIFYKPDWETYIYKNKCYGLPLITGGGFYILFYDVDQFNEVGLDPQKPPKTWSELEVYALKLTIKDGGKIERVGFDVNGMVDYPFKEWLFLNNGNLISNDRKKVLFDSPEGLQTLDWTVGFTDRLYGNYELLLPFTDRQIASGRYQHKGFYTGSIAMHAEGVWFFNMLAAEAPTKNLNAAEMPYNDRNSKAKVRHVFEGGWGYCIPTDAKNRDAAWEWLKYACIGQGAKDFFQAQLRPSAVKEYTEDPYYAENNPFWDVVVASLEKSDLSPVLPVQPEINKVIIQMTEEAILHKKSAKEAIEWGAAQAQKIVDEYWATQ